MPEIDQLSEIIGTLRAEVAENQRQHAASFRKLDSIEEKITKLAGAVELIAAAQTRIENEMKEEIRPAVSDFKALKNKGLGVIAFIGLASSGIGAALTEFLKS